MRGCAIDELCRNQQRALFAMQELRKRPGVLMPPELDPSCFTKRVVGGPADVRTRGTLDHRSTVARVSPAPVDVCVRVPISLFAKSIEFVEELIRGRVAPSVGAGQWRRKELGELFQ